MLCKFAQIKEGKRGLFSFFVGTLGGVGCNVRSG